MDDRDNSNDTDHGSGLDAKTATTEKLRRRSSKGAEKAGESYSPSDATTPSSSGRSKAKKKPVDDTPTSKASSENKKEEKKTVTTDSAPTSYGPPNKAWMEQEVKKKAKKEAKKKAKEEAKKAEEDVKKKAEKTAKKDRKKDRKKAKKKKKKAKKEASETPPVGGDEPTDEMPSPRDESVSEADELTSNGDDVLSDSRPSFGGDESVEEQTEEDEFEDEGKFDLSPSATEPEKDTKVSPSSPLKHKRQEEKEDEDVSPAKKKKCESGEGGSGINETTSISMGEDANIPATTRENNLKLADKADGTNKVEKPTGVKDSVDAEDLLEKNKMPEIPIGGVAQSVMTGAVSLTGKDTGDSDEK